MLIEAEVRHARKDLVGLAFQNLSTEAKESLEQILSLEDLAKHLTQVPSPVDHENEQWFSSGSALFFVLSEHKILLYWLGHFVSWTEHEGVLTGRTAFSSEKAQDEGLFEMETYVFEPDEENDSEKMNQALKLIKKSNLSEDKKEKALSPFQEEYGTDTN